MSTTVGVDLDSARKTRLKTAILAALKRLPPGEGLRIPTREYRSPDPEKDISAEKAIYYAVVVRELLVEHPNYLEAESFGESVTISTKVNLRSGIEPEMLFDLHKAGLLYDAERAAALDIEAHGGFPDNSEPTKEERAAMEQEFAAALAGETAEETTSEEPTS